MALPEQPAAPPGAGGAESFSYTIQRSVLKPIRVCSVTLVEEASAGVVNPFHVASGYLKKVKDQAAVAAVVKVGEKARKGLRKAGKELYDGTVNKVVQEVSPLFKSRDEVSP